MPFTKEQAKAIHRKHFSKMGAGLDEATIGFLTEIGAITLEKLPTPERRLADLVNCQRVTPYQQISEADIASMLTGLNLKLVEK